MTIELISDMDAVKEIDFVPQEYIETVTDGRGSVIAGYVEDEIIVLGIFSYMECSAEYVHIDYLYVLEEYRNKGYGREFLLKAEDAFSQIGVKKLYFDYCGFEVVASEWAYFFKHEGYSPVCENWVEQVYEYLLNEKNKEIRDKAINKLDNEKNIFCCKGHVDEIVKKSSRIRNYLAAEGLKLTEESLIYVDKETPSLEAALIIGITDQVISLKGTYGAATKDGAKIVAIISLLKYLSESIDLSDYQLDFRVENKIVGDAIRGLFRPNDNEMSLVKCVKEL